MRTRLDVATVPLQGGYIAKWCPVRIQNDILRPVEPRPASEESLARMADGIVFEASLLGELAGWERPGWVFIPEGLDREEAVADTRRAMEAGAELIAGGWLPIDEGGRRTGKPDLLIRSGSGYVPIDIKHHLTLDETEGEETVMVSELEKPLVEAAAARPGWERRKNKSDALQLAHYRRMLEACGWAAESTLAGIIGKEKVVVWYDLSEPMWQTPAKSDGRKRKTRTTMEVYDFEFNFRLDIAATAMTGRELLVEPVWCTECPECPWLDHCQPLLQAGSGDPSLLPSVGYREWRLFRDRGITDRAGVANLSYRTAVALLNGEEGIELDPATAAFGKASFLLAAILNARAATGSEPVYRLPGASGTEVPRADIEIDVDMENTNDGVYLWGALVTDRAGTGLAEPGYHPFVTWEPLDEATEMAAFDSFWSWLIDLRARVQASGVSLKAYCWYSSAENTQLKRIAAREPRLLAEVLAFIESGQWVDLEDVFKQSWTTGGSRSLKVIAPLAGHSWEIEDAGGGLSMVRHAEATNPDCDSNLCDIARRWLLTYNRGDVEATLLIRNWLTEGGSTWPEVATH